ncbi:MAG: ABC transporter substrate-binding protein, partial [Chloroflexota bacterium]
IIPISAAAIEFFATVGYSPGFRSTLFEQFLVSGFPYMQEMFDESFEGLSDPGLVFPPNVEILLELEADVLISAWGSERYPDFETLSNVVPIVFTTEGFTWQDELLFVGDLINEREAAEELITGYDERVEILRELLGDPSEISITVVRVAPENLQIRTSITFTSQILADVGFTYPEAQAQVIEESPEELLGGLSIMVSEERLDLMDADYIFLYPLSPLPDITQAVTDLLDNPIFQTLNASQAGNAHGVSSAWTLSGIHAAHAVLDDLFIYVAGVDPAEVSPNPFLVDEMENMEEDMEAEATEEASD